MSVENKIIEAKEGFEKCFKDEKLYNKQTKDDNHLNLLIEMIAPVDGDRILDLGTGTGYVAFKLAKYNPNTRIIGMDIIEDRLEINKLRASDEAINNVQFINYDGIKYPLESESIDAIVVRYALHHFPNLIDSFKEMKRVLKKEGRLVISDPSPNENDRNGFIDKYMQMKTDGHIKFYTFIEYKDMLEEIGFTFITGKDTYVRFPRNDSSKYKDLLKSASEDIKGGYKINIIDDEIWITEKVLNMIFKIK